MWTIEPAAAKRALETFSPTYHVDYARVRIIAREVLDAWGLGQEVSPGRVRILAQELRAALSSWGAGRRLAPLVNSIDDLMIWLMQTDHRQYLLQIDRFANFAASVPIQDSQVRCALVKMLKSFSLSCMQSRSGGLVGLTYPSKALLLLCGLGPAFDTQVRAGLRALGVGGWAATQFPTPDDPHGALTDRIMEVYARGREAVCNGGAEPSLAATLADPDGYADPRMATYVAMLLETRSWGRIIDILLFERSGLQSEDVCDMERSGLAGLPGEAAYSWLLGVDVAPHRERAHVTANPNRHGSGTGSPAFKQRVLELHRQGQTQLKAMQAAAREMRINLPESYVRYPGSHINRWRNQGFR